MRTSTIIVALLVAALAVAGPTGKKHKITPLMAARIAMHKVGGTVTKPPKLEHEDGQWQYEVIVTKKGKMTEVNVNADTGKIGSIEKTSAAEEAREAKKEGKGKG